VRGGDADDLVGGDDEHDFIGWIGAGAESTATGAETEILTEREVKGAEVRADASGAGDGTEAQPADPSSSWTWPRYFVNLEAQSRSMGGGGSALVVELAGPSAVEVESMSDDEVIHRCLSVLWSIYFDADRNETRTEASGDPSAAMPPLPPPTSDKTTGKDALLRDASLLQKDLAEMVSSMGLVHSHVTRWGSDPFSMGSYSALPVGAHHGAFKELAAPDACYAGRMIFAGEATSVANPGTVRGAYDSGVFQANALLQALGLQAAGASGSSGSEDEGT
jgi:hypothetical protein